MVEPLAFQDLMDENHCFGCGPENERGLRIKSRWADADATESVCLYHPEPHQNAGVAAYLNGGIIATLIDCHAVCTAVADAYRREGREMDVPPRIWYVTASMSITYWRPVPIDRPVELRARIERVEGRKTRVSCAVLSGGREVAIGEVNAARVPETWRQTSSPAQG